MSRETVWLLQASPRNAATGAVMTVRLAGGGTSGYRHFGTAKWFAGLERPPSIVQRLGYDNGEFGEGAVVQALELRWGGTEARAQELAAHYWGDAPFTLHRGPDGGADNEFTLVLAGRVADVQVSPGRLTLQMADPAKDLERPVLGDATFAGTGGIEGIAELKGRVKRRAVGRCRNVELWSLDPASNIWITTDPGRPLLAIDQLYDRGNAASSLVQVAWAGSIAATLAALSATPCPQGGGAVAPSIGCAKWWFANPGKLTCDLRGELGTGYIDRPADIAAWAVACVNGPAVNAASLIAARAARNSESGYLVSSETSAGAALNDVLGGVSLWWGLTSAGQLEFGEWAFGASAGALRGVTAARSRTHKPVKKVKLGYRRNHLTMARGDIAAAVLEAVYADGTPIDTLRPAAPGATPGATIGVDLKLIDASLPDEAEIITAEGIAAGIANQAPAATDPTIQPGATNDGYVDTRSTNRTPAWYRTNYPMRTAHEFKDSIAIGAQNMTAAGVLFGSLITRVDYPDSSGGAVKQEFIFGATLGGIVAGQKLVRYETGSSTWSAWAKDFSALQPPRLGVNGEVLTEGGAAIFDNMIRNDQISASQADTSNLLRFNAGGLYTGTLNANRTQDNIAAGFTGQTSWATYATFAPGDIAPRVSAGLDASGDLARNLTTSRLNSSNVLRFNAGGLFVGTLDANRTQDNIAAGITSQSPWATSTLLVPATVANQVQRLDGNGALEADWVYKASVGSIGARWPQEANANRTETRIASGFTGQGALATMSMIGSAHINPASITTYRLATNPGNLVANSDFATGDFTGWMPYNWPALLSVIARTDVMVPAGATTNFVARYSWTGTDRNYGLFAAEKAFNVAGADRDGFDVVPGEKLLASVEVAKDAAAVIGDFRIFAYFLKNDGTFTTNTSFSTSLQTLAAGAWHTRSGTLNVPAGALRCWLYANVSGHSAGNVFMTRLFADRLRRERDLDTNAVRLGTNIVRADGSTALTDATAVTSLGISAGFTGQTSWATYSTFAPGDIAPRVSVGLDANGDLARNLTTARLNSSNVLRFTGGNLYAGTMDANRTQDNISAGFTGQTAWATYSALAPATVAAKVQRLDGNGAIEADWLYKASVGSIGSFWPQEAAANKTETRVAAGIVGQGGLATLSSVSDAQLAASLANRVLPAAADSNFLGAARILYSTTATVEAMRPQEAGANVTEGRIAAGIAGQAPAATDTTIEPGADVTATAQITIIPPPPQIVYRNWQGVPKAGQFDRVLTPQVRRGETDIRTQNNVSYSIATSGVTATVNSTNGSADKGRMTVTAGGAGWISQTVTVAGVDYGPFAIPFAVQDDSPPQNNGGGGGSDASLASVAGTGFSQMTSVDAGESIFTVTIASGQKLVGTAPLVYRITAASGFVSVALHAKWQYRAVGSSTWLDMDSAIVGTAATYNANNLEGDLGEIAVNQEKSGLSAGNYEARLVGAKASSAGNAITIDSGTATLSLA